MTEFHAHSHTPPDVALHLRSDLEQGLTQQEAQERLRSHGPNELQEKPPPTLLKRLLDQFNNFVVILLIAAAIISALVAAATDGDYIDSIAIIAIVVLNAVLGVVQEGRAEAALRALKKMAAPEARVIREGKVRDIASKAVVPGDVVLLETGNYVPADIRLVEAFNLTIEEASLTGESVPSEKRAAMTLSEDAPLGDRHNMAFLGTLITYGRGKGIVVDTGMQTVIGRIAEAIQSYEDPPTPLQQRLDQLGRWLGYATLAICAIVFVVGLLRQLGLNPIGNDLGAWLGQNEEMLIQLFMVAISLAIAAVPEGLPAIVTIALALGMQRMIRRHVLIRKLAAVETLGSANVICSDKTGTLTSNEMTVVRLYADGRVIDVSGEGYRPEGRFLRDGVEVTPAENDTLTTLTRGALLCNDAVIQQENGAWTVVGDPTEGALVTLAAKGGLWQGPVSEAWPRVAEVPFDSDRKRMTTIHQSPNGSVPFHAFTKGAPELVLEHCTTLLCDGKTVALSSDQQAAILRTNTALAGDALRVLALAYRPLDAVPDDPEAETLEQDLTFVGLIAMRDPARPEVKEAIALATHAGIRTVMITGDYPDTAAAIADELGLLENREDILTGVALNDLSDDALVEKAEQINVYARVSPTHKMRIVEALQQRDNIVAMTGDGVNDAPALKRSHIGVAMGITGTDVSKQTADMVLTDDNFASIVSAVEEGRVIYANIRKFVFYLISCNVGEILIIFLAIMLGLPFLPLLPIHLLWLNLVTDGAPALALGLETREPDIMDRKPRPAKEPIITRELWILTAVQSVVETFVTLGIFLIALQVFPGQDRLAQTLAFSTLVTAELIRAFTARSERYNLWQIGFFSNKAMLYAVGLSFVLLLAVIYLPFLQPIFETQALDLGHWLLMLPAVFLPAAVAELAKYVLRRRDMRAAATA